ncbi:MAG: sigma-E factor negative regulatory protein [Proteobacteria bacterium]|nr:sigma-E factor negative regulatory protein [Pseudomonadota bacterium]
MNEELDSQLSAMFDDELPPSQCELLARRLSRDEALKARWGRYAIVGAVIRAEGGVRLNAPLAGRVKAVLSAEPSLAAQALVAVPPRRRIGWWQPVAGAGLAAGVAAVSVLWLRAQSPLPGAPLAAARLPAPAAVPAVNTGGGYVVPATLAVRPMMAPSTELANYVVAHSVVSSPLARRNLLSSFIAGEPSGAGGGEARAPENTADAAGRAQ